MIQFKCDDTTNSITDIVVNKNNKQYTLNSSSQELKMFEVELPIDYTITNQELSLNSDFTTFIDSLLILDRTILTTSEERKIEIDDNHLIKIKKGKTECHLQIADITHANSQYYLFVLKGFITYILDMQHTFSYECNLQFIGVIAQYSQDKAGLISIYDTKLHINHTYNSINLIEDISKASIKPDTIQQYITNRNNIKLSVGTLTMTGINQLKGCVFKYITKDGYCEDYRKNNYFRQINTEFTVPSIIELSKDSITNWELETNLIGIDNKYYWIKGTIMFDSDGRYVNSDLLVTTTDSVPKIFFAIKKIGTELIYLSLYTDYSRYQLGIAYSATNKTPTKDNNSAILASNTFSNIHIPTELNNLLPASSSSTEETFKYYLRFYLDTNFAAVNASNRVYDTVTYVVYVTSAGRYGLTTIDEWNTKHNDSK